jgi:hypothetical protein
MMMMMIFFMQGIYAYILKKNVSREYSVEAIL